MIELEHVGPVWVLHLHSGENRLNEDFVGEVNGALEEVETAGLPTALVTTGEGKFYSNGLDLDWLGTSPDPASFMDEVHRLLVRVLMFPAVTVAAVNGHAFAAGAMLATAHDFMIMRSDRGYWCLPEVDLGLPLTPTMHAVVAARLPRTTLHEAVTTGKRYDAPAAVAARIATDSGPEGDVVAKAVALATELAGKNPDVVAKHKQLMYGDIARLIAT
ncbi:MAG TPA: enoyl-CoA hydratase-related protein [Acidimicrobiales bacterium]|nr:enoyl-CoA hydratase-related protein [Acidimicrobiales bacterium]